jgi:hypothetical protein
MKRSSKGALIPLLNTGRKKSQENQELSGVVWKQQVGLTLGMVRV